MPENEVVQLPPPPNVGMPNMQAQVTERPVNAASPGPFFVYLPGISMVGLRNTTHAFNEIRAGEAFKISNIKKWTRKGLLPEGAASYTREVHDWMGNIRSRDEAFEIPAETTLSVLLGYGSLTGHGFTQIGVFDKTDPQETLFNQLIHPEYIEELAYPAKWKSILEVEGGMLALRLRWLNEAKEALKSGRGLLETFHRAIEKQPYLRDIWSRAIEGVLIPSIEGFVLTANLILAKKEGQIQDKEKKGYDHYDQVLMWLLGRKPERTALARTMEVMGRPGTNSGLSVADVQTMIDNARADQGVVVETVPCPDCGNKCETVYGAAPRICWRCKYEFPKMEASPILDQQASPVITKDEIEDLANQIKPPNPKKR